MEYEFYDSRYGFPLECMNFYDKLTSYERYLHLNDPNLRDFYTIDIFYQIIQNHIFDWNEDLKQFILRCQEYIYDKVENNTLLTFWRSRIQTRIKIVLTSDQLEFGLPFTLENYIFIPYSMIFKNYRLNNYHRMAQILFHERIHITQRMEGKANKMNIFTLLSDKLGYIYYDTKFPPFIYKNEVVKNWIQNPDTYEHGVWFYKYKDNLYFYILNVKEFKGNEKRKLERIGFVYNIQSKYWTRTNFIPFKNKFAQYEHPYEIISEALVDAVFKGFLITSDSEDITKWTSDYIKYNK